MAAVAFGASATAHAGAVSLSYDPAYGGSQTSLSYRGTVQFTASDSCVGAAPGTVTIATSSCGGPLLASASLTLFNTSAPSSSITAFFTLAVNSLTVRDGYIIGFDTGGSPLLTSFYGSSFAGDRDYQLLQIQAGLPLLVSAERCGPAGTCYTNLEVANRESFEAYVIHRNDAGDSPLGNDASGHPINWYLSYNNGQLSGVPTTAVPEPTPLALFAAGLAALAWRRHGRSRSAAIAGRAFRLR